MIRCRFELEHVQREIDRTPLYASYVQAERVKEYHTESKKGKSI